MTLDLNLAGTNLLAWTGVLQGPWVNFASVPVASGTNFPQAPDSSYGSAAGPAFVPLADGVTAYLFWVNTSGVVQFAQATLNTTTPAWTLSTTATSITGSNVISGGGVDAILGVQNGTPVINVVWQDQTQKALTLCQIPYIGGTPTSFTLIPLGGSAVDTPCVTSQGPVTFLSYTDSNGNLNIATAVGNLAFDFTNRFISSPSSGGYASNFGPCLVPISGLTLGYVVWTAQSGLVSYAQLGTNSQGQIQFNPASGCSGNLAGSTSVAAPAATLVTQVQSGVVTNLIQIVWPDKNTTPYANGIQYTTITPVYTPL